jgi:hypothetical protein
MKLNQVSCAFLWSGLAAMVEMMPICPLFFFFSQVGITRQLRPKNNKAKIIF